MMIIGHSPGKADAAYYDAPPDVPRAPGVSTAAVASGAAADRRCSLLTAPTWPGFAGVVIVTGVGKLVLTARRVMLLLLDNYDSFTYNLFHYLGELGARVVVLRNDAVTVDDALALRPQAIVISPGPCDPDRAGISVDLVRGAAEVCPILGVCLGHQAIAQAFGGRIVRASQVMHGKISEIEHEGEGLFHGLPSPFAATRYHSLVAEPATLPDCLEVTARTQDGVIMAVRHRELPIHGVQFHPESIETQHGHHLLSNFLALIPPRGNA
jgi:anthranilate synthase component 2